MRRRRTISQGLIRWPVRPLKAGAMVVPAVRGRDRDKVVGSVAVVRVRAELAPASGDTIVRVRAVAPKVLHSPVHAVDSVVAPVPATTSRAAAHRAMVPHVVVVVVAAVPQAHSDVRAASPRRRVRTVWRSVTNMRS